MCNVVMQYNINGQYSIQYNILCINAMANIQYNVCVSTIQWLIQYY